MQTSGLAGGRILAVSCTDAAGSFWLFGGYGLDSGGSKGQLNDLWKYNSGQWTWISGSDLGSQFGTYGTQGVAASSNVPGARQSPVTWIDASGNLWLFGGYGGASQAVGELNDLWEYTP